MRAAFVSTMDGVPWGGSEFLWAGAAARLAANGDAVAASVRHWPALHPRIAALAAAGCRLHVRPPPTRLGRVARRLGLDRHRGFGWLARFRPDVAVLSLGIHTEGTEPAAACRAFGIPYVLLVQSADDNRWPADPQVDRLREAYLGAKACFFVSGRNRRLLETMLAVRLPDAVVVRNPFNVRYDAAPAWPADTGELRLACVAALAPVAKGQDLVFAALARPEWRRRPVRLSLFGGGPNERSLKALAALWELDRVTFHGFTDDIEAVWAEHHALVLMSRHEGLPLALVEAMLCGRVPIVTDVAGHTELVDDGTTGFVAAGPTEAAVRDALERAWERRADGPTIGAAAARAVRAKVPADPIGAFLTELKRCL